jgi:hypothetical protein
MANKYRNALFFEQLQRDEKFCHSFFIARVSKWRLLSIPRGGLTEARTSGQKCKLAHPRHSHYN